ncbi:MAG: peptidoglycan-binding protein [Pyrinomonadaceae bacterium]|nr:peptidoglycan-binding protein [Pyrinomonadaceae bacterium]
MQTSVSRTGRVLPGHIMLTAQAVEEFQAAHGLTPDGVVGRRDTWGRSESCSDFHWGFDIRGQIAKEIAALILCDVESP